MSKKFWFLVFACFFAVGFILVPAVIKAADDVALPPPPDANEDLVPPPPGDNTSAAPSSDALPPPPAEGEAAAAPAAPAGGEEGALPPPPAEGEAVAPPAEGEAAAAPVAEQPAQEEAGLKGSLKKYTIKRGDTLWGISGMDDVYGDHFKWPLVFKANRANIDDPDIIYPRQLLKVSRSFTQDEIDDAVSKAKETPGYEPHSKPRKKLPIKY